MKIKLPRIKPQIIKTRKFLERNKIFIEIFSLLIVGFAGIIFAYFQWKTSEMQLYIQEAEKQPLFRINFSETSNFYKPLEKNELKKRLGFNFIKNTYLLEPTFFGWDSPSYKKLFDTIITRDGHIQKCWSIYMLSDSFKIKKYRDSMIYTPINKYYNCRMHEIFETIYNEIDSIRRNNWNIHTESYQILNQGYAIKDFNHFVWTFYELTHVENNKIKFYHIIYIDPFFRYDYSDGSNINNEKNSLGLLTSNSTKHKSSDEYDRIWTEFQNDADFKDTERDSWYLLKHDLIVIHYLDVFNRYQTVYFLDNLPISNNRGEKIKKKIKKQKGIKPSDVTLKIIKKLCEK